MAASSAIDSERLESDYYLWHATHADLARQTGDFATDRPHRTGASMETGTASGGKGLICRKLDSLTGHDASQTPGNSQKHGTPESD